MKEIDKRLLKLATKTIKPIDSINRIGLRVPVVRAQLKKDLFFIGESEKEALKYWDNVWKESLYFESMSLAIYFYQHKDITKQEFNVLKTWINRVNCWEHSDDLSKIYAHVLENNPEWVIPVFRKWNKAKCPWKRRQSIVGLLEYTSKRKKILPFAELISFVEPLLEDKEYYVQKGVGWTLREIYNAYPQKTLSYLNKKLLSIDSIAYSAATKKLDKVIKMKMNLKRKEHRKRQNFT